MIALDRDPEAVAAARATVEQAGLTMFERIDASEERPTLFAPLFFAFGRRPASSG